MSLVILFRQSDSNFPFLWEPGVRQRAARWHAENEGPAQYFADTPDGAWAEFLRHEEITEPMTPEEVTAEFKRTLWAIEVEIDHAQLSNVEGKVSGEQLVGDETSYLVCQAAARDLRAKNVKWLQAPSAALLPAAAGGYIVESGKLGRAAGRDGKVFVYFGKLDAVGWRCGTAPLLDSQLIKNVRTLVTVRTA
jgi:hypothetical protein